MWDHEIGLRHEHFSIGNDNIANFVKRWVLKMRSWWLGTVALAVVGPLYPHDLVACGGTFGSLCNIGNVGKKAIGDVSNTINKGLDDISRGGHKAIEDASKTLDKAGKDTVSTIGKAYEDAIQNLKKTVSDGSNNINKAFDDTVRTYAKAINDVIDAEKASVRFIENEVRGVPDILSNAEKRVREGKVVDAIWHLQTDKLKNTSKNAAEAASESDVINAAGQAAAGFYGGPAGSAAYAAWFAYEKTGNFDLAVRAGIVSGIASYGQSVATMPQGTIGEVIKKAAVTGAIGGASVAAAGGDEEAVKQAFIKSGSMVIVQSSRAYIDNKYVEPQIDKADQFCMTAVGNTCQHTLPELKLDSRGKVLKDINGTPLVNTEKILSIRENIGIWREPSAERVRQARDNFTKENIIAIGDSKWVASYDRNSLMNRSANLPAVTLTYIGDGSPVAENLSSLKRAIQQADDRDTEIRVALSNSIKRNDQPGSTWVALGDLSTGASYFQRLQPSDKRGDADVGDILESKRDLRVRPFPASADVIGGVMVGETVVVIDIELADGSDGIKRRWAKIATVPSNIVSEEKEQIPPSNSDTKPDLIPEPKPIEIRVTSPPVATTLWCIDETAKNAFEISPALKISGLTINATGKARKRNNGGLEIFVKENVQIIPDLFDWPLNSTSVMTSNGRLMRYDDARRLVKVGQCRSVLKSER